MSKKLSDIAAERAEIVSKEKQVLRHAAEILSRKHKEPEIVSTLKGMANGLDMAETELWHVYQCSKEYEAKESK